MLPGTVKSLDILVEITPLLPTVKPDASELPEKISDALGALSPAFLTLEEMIDQVPSPEVATAAFDLSVNDVSDAIELTVPTQVGVESFPSSL